MFDFSYFLNSWKWNLKMKIGTLFLEILILLNLDGHRKMIKNPVKKTSKSWIWNSYLSKNMKWTFGNFSKGIPSTPQPTDSHPCTRPGWSETLNPPTPSTLPTLSKSRRRTCQRFPLFTECVCFFNYWRVERRALWAGQEQQAHLWALLMLFPNSECRRIEFLHSFRVRPVENFATWIRLIFFSPLDLLSICLPLKTMESYEERNNATEAAGFLNFVRAIWQLLVVGSYWNGGPRQSFHAITYNMVPGWYWSVSASWHIHCWPGQ